MASLLLKTKNFSRSPRLRFFSRGNESVCLLYTSTHQAEARRQLRVAAYCRVSTKEEDQANSYEVQKEYYTDKIMSNTAWTMAGIFADKGITGTSAKKREDFMRMIRHCRQKKIDVILTKSVSRFSRNTVDCLYYIRALKQLGIAVIFEKENINSLEEDSELRITLSRELMFSFSKMTAMPSCLSARL